MARPHDVSDLLLAPVALALDAGLEELGRAAPSELQHQVAVVGDRPNRSREQREDGLMAALTHNVALHGRVRSWDARGLRLTPEEHTLALGLPPSLSDYLAVG